MASSQSTLSGTAELDLAIVDLTGSDAREWLQGQVTQDLRTLTPGGSTRACLCKPTGQILGHLEVWDLGATLRLLIHQRELPALLTRIEEAVIMEDVEAVVVPARVKHLYGELLAPENRPPDDRLPKRDFMRWRTRTGVPGVDFVLVESAPPPVEPGEHALPSDPLLFDVLTLAAGEPIPGVDTNEKTLPPELGPAFEAATTSYRKGCYTGQEVLMRIHSRGHTNRTWRGLLSTLPLENGARVLADGAQVGNVTRAGVHPTLGPIAAAFLRREADGKVLTVETTAGTAAVEARDLPLSSE